MPGFKFNPRWQDIADLVRTDPDRFYAMMEDRERGLEAYLDYGESTYTPEITATTTAPSIGTTGYQFGAFSLQGRQCDWWVEIVFAGSGISGGSGTILVPLPMPPVMYTQAGNAVNRTVGGGYLNDNGTQVYGATCVVVASVSTTHFVVSAHTTSPVTWTNSNPFTPAAGDALRVQGHYTVDEQ